MRDISVVMAYYENPTMLARQYKSFDALPFAVKNHFEYVVVDDGSPRSPADPPSWELTYGFQLWRMDQDIRWNQDACRNLGVKYAKHPWVLITDMDHMIPDATLRAVMTEHLSERAAYKFTRVNDQTFDAYKPHPNSWLMTKKLYDEIGGYDERFAGWYGTDWDFRDRVVLKAQYVKMLPYPLVRVGREHTPDASCPREFGRKTPRDAQMIRDIRVKRGGKAPERDRFSNHMVFRWP